MARRLFQSKTDSRSRKRRNDTSSKNQFGQFEQLEDKRCLAFVGFSDGVTLTLVQTIDDGDIVVDNVGLGGAWQVTDNSGSLSFVDAENLVIELLDDTANQINVDVIFQHDGNITIEAGDGPRDIQFTGAGIPLQSNVITGDLTINAGDSVQNILWSPVIGFPINIGGNFNVDTGDGFDSIFNSENFATVGGDVNLVGVNNFVFTDFLFPTPLDAFLTVGGNFTMDTSNESTESFFLDAGTFLEAAPDPDEERTVIGGNFTYIGGDDIDHVDLNNIHIRGDLDIDLGDGIPFFGDPQNITTTLIAPRVLDGEGGGPYFEVNGNVRIATGDASLDNIIDLSGYFDGETVEFDLGNTVDIVNYNLIGPQADLFGAAGSGDDLFTLSQQINSISLDFGNDPGDLFFNNVGLVNFDASFFNYHFFDHIFTIGDSTLELTQLIDTGDVTIDNTGGVNGVSWRVFTPLSNGGTGSSVPADNLIVNLIDNTENDLIVDLANPVLAFLTLNLGDGDRNVDFVGASNNPLRDITITADAGQQNVDLSVNAALAVATLTVDLGSGFDTVDDDANNLMLSEDLVFRGVNNFENDGFLSVGRNVFIDTTDDASDNVFANNQSFIVAGSFNYVGGDGRDELRLNGAAGNSIGQGLSVDLGDNLAGGTQMVLLDMPATFIGGPLTVQSTNANSEDLVLTSPNASLAGDVLFDLGNGNNTAVIAGAFSGTNINYIGGDQVDDVAFGTTGNPANFTAVLGQGDDIFTLLAGANVNSPLVVNFGGNNDTFFNQSGPFAFDAELIGLNGFNHLFDFAADQLTSVQIIDQGDILIDNNGTLEALRFTTNGASSDIAPINNLDLILLGGTGNNVDVDLDNAFSGDFLVNAGSGPRNISFTGDNNSVGGLLSITAGSGDQTFNAAVNGAINVGGDLAIDLGLGNDQFVDGGNDINVTGNFDLTGVNSLINTGNLAVDGNLSVENGGEMVDSVFENAGTVNIVGDFSYNGSQAADSVLFTSLLAGSVLGGDINLTLAGGANEAVLEDATFGGQTVNYVGGSETDRFVYSLTGAPADITAILGAGDDSFELGAGVVPNSLVVDFGTGNDTFINPNGALNFPATLQNLNGFDFQYDSVQESLVAIQVDSSGSILVDDNGPANSIQVTAGGQSTVLGPVSDLTISLLDGSGDDLIVDLDSALAGDLTVDLGGGLRTFSLVGTSNSIGGNLQISGTGGSQSLIVENNLSVDGDLAINLGSSVDSLSTFGNDLTVGGNANVTGINQFTNSGTTSIAGNLAVDNSAEGLASSLIDNAILDIAGDFDYAGGIADDIVTLSDSSSVGGNINVRSGNGNNETRIAGNFGGSTIRFSNGTGSDSVQLGTTGADANVIGSLGAGDDSFILDANTDIATNVLRVDFGGGDDSFDNNFGQFDFNATLLNLDGFNAVFNLASGNLDITQVVDTGDVTVDDKGLDNAIRFGTPGELNELTPVNDLRVILQDNTSGDVTADFDSVRNGNTTIQLNSGDRDLFFTGVSNTFNGLLRVEADQGVQTIHTSINTSLDVSGTLIINTRDASDTVLAANPVNVSNALLLRGVNRFVNNTGLDVGGDFNVITSLENTETRLISNTTFNVGGNLTYIGGGGVDVINFNETGATIGGFTFIDIATSTDPQRVQSVQLTGGFSTSSLVIDGATGAAGNLVFIDNAGVVNGGLVVVNFAGSTTQNTAVFNGTYTGTFATYRGGSASDFVLFGAQAPDAVFAVLTGGGNDVLTIAATADLNFLFGDLGDDDDTLDNQFGDSFPFDSNIINI